MEYVHLTGPGNNPGHTQLAITKPRGEPSSFFRLLQELKESLCLSVSLSVRHKVLSKSLNLVSGLSHKILRLDLRLVTSMSA